MKIECVWNNYPLLEIFFAKENSHSVRPVVKNKVRPLASTQPAWLDGFHIKTNGAFGLSIG
jgi:hypothetical protein